MPLSHPLLPIEFVQQVEANPMMVKFRSKVYTKECHINRLRMRDWHQPLSPDSGVIMMDSSTGFTKEAGRTSVHMACFDGDVLMLSEFLRCGAAADKTDSAGISPLYLALSQMASMKFIIQYGITQHGLQHDDGTPWQEVDFRHAISQHAWLAQILVEQHADVNRDVRGVSVLHLACQSVNWETISLLLQHGATPQAHLTSYFTSLAERNRLSALIRANPPSCPRPPRICPCWSGKTISDCHGKQPLSYPLHFICVCGSGKTYDRCCSQKTPVMEEWNQKSQRIIHGFDFVSDKKMPERFRQLQQTVQARAVQHAKLGALLGIENEDRSTISSISLQQPDNPNVVQAVVSDFLSKGLIDPAFAYAVSQCGFVPKPCGRNRSRKICEESKTRWNAHVDKYIVEFDDPRPRFDIERAAKIGTWNGALIRRCEGDGCKKSESKDVMMKFCSKCKIAVYCSASCQKSAWKFHKAVCGSDDQCEQALPSQETFQREMSQLQEGLLQEFYTMAPPSMVSSMIKSLTQGHLEGAE